MKRVSLFIIIVLIIALMGLSVACTGAENQSNTGQEDTTKEEGEQTKPVEKVQITYWEMMWGPADKYTAAVEELVNKFNDTHSDIEVKVQMVPWDNFYQTFLTAVTSGAAPDVSTGAFPQPIQYAQMGEILPLDSIVEQWQKENSSVLDDLMPGSLELYQYEGQQAGIPWNLDPRVIVYRKDVFEQAGVSKMPETWDDFINTCRAIKNNTDVNPFVFAAADQMGTQVMLHFMLMNNVGITDENVKPNFEDPKVIKTLELFGTLHKEGLIPEGTISYKGADAEKLYYSGKAAMYFTGPPQGIFDYPDVANNSGILPPFAGPDGEKGGLVWPNAIMAYKQSKSPEAAKTFIKWWIENNLPLWTEGNAGALPSRSSFTKDPHFTSNWVAKETAEKVVPVGKTPVWPAKNLYSQFSQIEGENYLAIAVQDVLSGQTDYAAIAKKVNDMIKKTFEE